MFSETLPKIHPWANRNLESCLHMCGVYVGYEQACTHNIKKAYKRKVICLWWYSLMGKLLMHMFCFTYWGKKNSKLEKDCQVTALQCLTVMKGHNNRSLDGICAAHSQTYSTNTHFLRSNGHLWCEICLKSTTMVSDLFIFWKGKGKIFCRNIGVLDKDR